MSAKTYHFKWCAHTSSGVDGPGINSGFIDFLGAAFPYSEVGCHVVYTTYWGRVALAVGDYAIKVTIPLESGNLTIVDVGSMGHFHDHFIESGDVLM